jgi:hypothetical protein
MPKEIKDKHTNWLIVDGIFLCAIVIGVVVLIANHSRSIAISGRNFTTNSKTGSSTAAQATTTSLAESTGTPLIAGAQTTTTSMPPIIPFVPLVPMVPVDAGTYNAKLLAIANIPIISRRISPTSTIFVTSTAPSLWPVKTAPLPDAGAILPFKRIVAYYGNLYSTQMGILGQYPAPQVMAMLASTTAAWNAADPTTPVVPALDYIVVTAQGSPGADGKYRLRMPDSQIDQILSMASQVNGLVFLDIQVGLSNVETEVPLLEKYLQMPQVELSLDPEFDMHNGQKPGTVVGTMDAADINWAAEYLANLVKQYNLPPKILVVHRFTDAMVTHTSKIAPLPEVQVVMDMDGFGTPSRKLSTYQEAIVSQPVQFTGFKLFYHNDAVPTIGGHLMTPTEVLKLSPQPSYIQYE